MQPGKTRPPDDIDDYDEFRPADEFIYDLDFDPEDEFDDDRAEFCDYDPHDEEGQ